MIENVREQRTEKVLDCIDWIAPERNALERVTKRSSEDPAYLSGFEPQERFKRVSIGATEGSQRQISLERCSTAFSLIGSYTGIVAGT